MPDSDWLRKASPAFQLMIATSWIAPDWCRIIQDEAVQRACDASPHWTEYLELIDRHRTSGSSWAVLKRTPSAYVPEQVKRELQRRADLCQWRAVLHLQVLAGVLKGLNSIEIPVIPLKGPLLSFALYRDAGLRQSKDLDILVPQSEIRRAQKCLESMGWQLGAEYFSLSTRQWEATFRHEQHVGYTHPQYNCELELHWKWYSTQNGEQYWARSRATELSGFSYRAMSDEDLAIYLCGHGSAHQWFRARWLGDLARLRCNTSPDWTSVLAYARSTGHERSVLLGLQLLTECYNLTFPVVPTSTRLPSSLVAGAVRALAVRSEPIERSEWTRCWEAVQAYGYNRTLWPHRSLKANLSKLMYRRLDFRVLRLPDRFFWLYKPLRPVLWLWRHLKRRNPTVPLPPVSPSASL
jgi:hypothetical protein